MRCHVYKKSIDRAIYREKILKVFKNSEVEDVDLDFVGNKYVVDLYTSKIGIIIGTQGSVISKFKEVLSKILKGDVEINVLPIEASKSLFQKELFGSSLLRRLCMMILDKINHKRACSRIIELIKKSNILGAKIELRGPLKKIRREEYIQSIGSYKILSDNQPNFEISHRALKLPGGIIGVTITIVHKQDSLPDKFSLKGEIIRSELETGEDTGEPKEELKPTLTKDNK